MIFARKVNKISEFHMIFARKMPEFYVLIARKIFSPNLGGGHVPPVPRLLCLQSCVVELMRLVTGDDIMTPLLRKLSIVLLIKIHAVKPLCSVSKLSTESVGSRRELVVNCVRTPTPTRQLRRVGVTTVWVCLRCFC